MIRAALARTDADGAPALPPGARAAEFEAVAGAAVAYSVHSLVGGDALGRGAAGWGAQDPSWRLGAGGRAPASGLRAC
jgi:hypothetical protein